MFAAYLGSSAVISVATMFVDLGTSSLGQQIAQKYSTESVIRSFRLLRLFGTLASAIPVLFILHLLFPNEGFVFACLCWLQVAVTIESRDWMLLSEQMAGRLYLIRCLQPLGLLATLLVDASNVEWLAASRLVMVCLSICVVITSVRQIRRPGQKITTSQSARLVSPVFFGSFFSQIYASRLDQVLLRTFSTSTELGRYATTYSIYSGALLPLQTVLASEIPRLVSEVASKSFEESVRKFRVRSLCFGFASFVITLVGGLVVQPLLFSHLQTSSSTVLALAIAGLLVAVGAGAGYPLFAYGKNALLLPIAAAGAISNLVSNFVLIGRYGASGAAWSMTFAEGAMALASWHVWTKFQRKIRN
jgi:O-antigen/teichoic acid export membrane protein